MASPDSNHNFAPIRTENILTDQEHLNNEEQGHGEYSYKEDEVERPEAIHSSSSTDEDDGQLTRVQTSKSARERRAEFEPIHAGDRQELNRIASTFDGGATLSRTQTTASSALERRDTLAGVNIGDPVLDPTSPEFDVYKWTRM